MLGQSTQMERSTVEQVREKIAQLRAETREATTAKTYDFEQRLADIRAKEQALRDERKAKKKAAKEAERMELVHTAGDAEQQAQDEMAQMMGFSGFGTTKK